MGGRRSATTAHPLASPPTSLEVSKKILGGLQKCQGRGGVVAVMGILHSRLAFQPGAGPATEDNPRGLSRQQEWTLLISPGLSQANFLLCLVKTGLE